MNSMFASLYLHLNSLVMAASLQAAGHRISLTWKWYIVRAAGFVAAGLLILLMLSGIGQVTGIIFRWIEPVKAWAIHRALAIALLVAVATHILFLWMDHYISFSWVQIVIPFTSSYKSVHLFGIPLGSLWVAFGILATYLIITLVATSLGWIDTKRGTWKKLHYFSYLVIVLVFFHALGLGSDLRYGAFRQGWILIGLTLIGATLIRLWRVGTIKKTDTSS